MLTQGFLDLDGSLNRLDRTGELGQQCVAGGVDHAATAAHDERAMMSRQDLRVSTVAVSSAAIRRE
jgi:hypothetical protein